MMLATADIMQEGAGINTFRTHPWMITDGPGDCIQIILPAAEPATVTLK